MASRPRAQRGVALITAVLVVALATAAAAAVASRQLLQVRRTENVLNAEQAYMYALGAEDWARHVLVRDDPDVDGPEDEWATVLPPIEVRGGRVGGRIEDLQGRLDVNALVRGGEVDAAALARFERLLAVLELDASIAQAVLDWLDPDIEPRFPDGAEDDYYLNREPAYRAGNRAMVSTSELRLVRGIEEAAYERLAPHVAALPAPASININTATAPVLRSLAPEISAADAEALRESRPFETLGDFLGHEALAGRGLPPAGLAVASGYFRLAALAEVGRSRSRLYSLLRRAGEEQVEVVRRNRGAP